MRTVKDFVRKMFQEGKPPSHIKAVASNTQWKNKMDEINYWIKVGLKTKKKKRKLKKLKIKKIN